MTRVPCHKARQRINNVDVHEKQPQLQGQSDPPPVGVQQLDHHRDGGDVAQTHFESQEHVSRAQWQQRGPAAAHGGALLMLLWRAAATQPCKCANTMTTTTTAAAHFSSNSSRRRAVRWRLAWWPTLAAICCNKDEIPTPIPSVLSASHTNNKSSNKPTQDEARKQLIKFNVCSNLCAQPQLDSTRW